MAPNNGLANAKNKKPNDAQKSKSPESTTILPAGTVESRGMGTNVNSRHLISSQIQSFLHGEARASPTAECRAFFTVWTFVTRLPGPTWVDHHPGYLMRGMAYFPLSGALIGCFVSVFFDLAHLTMALPITVAVVVSTAASLWITGCFHEDGLADAADGIGGGWSRDQILKIMTDTRLGTYGCAILLLYIIAKVELLSTAGGSVWKLGDCAGAGPAIVVTHTLARLTAPLLIRTRDYVDEQGPKYKFYSFFVEAKHLVSWHRVGFAIATSFVVSSLSYGIEKAVILVGCVFVAAFFSGRYAEYLLGGVMGDYLGATICVTEVFLLTVLELLSRVQDHKAFLSELSALASEFVSGSITLDTLGGEIIDNDRLMALLKFTVVAVVTTIWCSCVGHPPVFVRTSVIAKGDSDEIRISLVGGNDTAAGDDQKVTKTPSSALEVALSNDEDDFETRYDVARKYLDSLAKPVGSLGTLEDWAARLAVLRRCPKPLRADKVACLIFAGDHGVAKDKNDGGYNCSAYPQAVTRKVVEALEHDIAGASVLAKANNVSLRVVDVGLAIDSGGQFGSGNVVVVSEHKINGGTKNFCHGPAMSDVELRGCILAGREETKRFMEETHSEVLVFGEVGIGNTTTSSALIAALTQEPVETLCGSGATKSGVGDETIISNKIKIINDALDFHGIASMINNPTMAMEKVGGAEIAAIVGGILYASENDIPVLVDGFIVTTAAMIATLLSPDVCRVLFFATKSTEIGQSVAIKTIQRISKQHNIPVPPEPALDMNLRMGEGSGALMAVPLLRSAAAVISDLATLEAVLDLKLEESSSSTIC